MDMGRGEERVRRMERVTWKLPDPRGAGIEADKIAAYELEDMRVKQEQKMRTLEDLKSIKSTLNIKHFAHRRY